MPVHRDREKKEITAEEMEVEEQEQEASSSEEEDSDTSSVSEDGDSSGEKVLNSRKWAFNIILIVIVFMGAVKRNIISVCDSDKKSSWCQRLDCTSPLNE